MDERAGDPWPASATFGDGGLVVGGVRAEDLVTRFGTPLVVADEGHLRERARTFAALFPHPVYAVKAFTSQAMLRLATEEGLDLLVATDGELEACLRAGIPASRVVMHGNDKSDAELALAVRVGVRLVNVDNREELERLDAVAAHADVVQQVLVRVLPEVGAGAHRAIRTGQMGSKFGIPLEEMPGAIRRAMDLPHVDPVGIHAHIGSQVLAVEPYLQEIDVLLDLLARLRDETGFVANVVDVGGGFGVAYTDEPPLRLDAVAPAVLQRVREGARDRGLPLPHTLVEPGRSVVGSGMLTLYRVGSVKRGPDGRTLVAVDGGMSDNVRPMLYGARYTVAMAGPPRPGDRTVVDVVGRHCESGDVLAREVDLPAVPRRDDLLAFAATGGYSYSMAGNYNRVGRPAVVAVRDGTVRPWLRREDAADLDRLEIASPAERLRPVPPDGVEIRPARPVDARSFRRLYEVVAAERRFIRTERVSRTVLDLRRRFRRSWTRRRATIVAATDGEIVGSLEIQRDAHPVTRHVATFGMMVAPGWRRRGVGAALVAAGIRWAREMGVEKLELSVYPGNAAAIALYRRFGFVEEGRLRRHSRKSYGDEDEILMGMWLGGDEA